MYSLVNNIAAFCRKKDEKDMSFGVFGCDNAGKTTLILSFCGEAYEPEQVGPTFGMKSYLHKDGTHNIKLLDLGGGKKFRNFWKSNFPEMHGMIFVIDSACPERFDESGDSLFEMLKDPLVADKPVLIFANKQDLPTALAQGEMAKRMQLDEKVSAKNWRIQDCVALKTPDEELDTRVQQGRTVAEGIAASTLDFDRLDARVTQDVTTAKEQEKKEREAAKEARRKRREARERKQAEEEAQAAEAAMQAAEQAEVAVPMKIQVENPKAGGDTNVQPKVAPVPAEENKGAAPEKVAAPEEGTTPEKGSGSPQGSPTAPASLPPLKSVPKAKVQELVLSGSPLPQESSTVVDPNVPVSPLNKTLHSES